MKRIMIAGTNSGVGKTTISMGLMSVLSQTHRVMPYKVGPDYIDSAYHSFITGNTCSNLDSYLLDKQMINYLFSKNNENRDIAVIEGVMGLFDGNEVGSDIGTTASIAKILDIPVILVVDGSSVASSIAATVKGFNTFDEELKIAGVIINNVGSKAHYELLKKAIMFHTNVIPCGYLLKNSVLTLPERHLGLVPVHEQDELKNVFTLLGKQIKETVDIEKILEIADKPSKADHLLKLNIAEVNRPLVRIAIAKDKAFNFYYQDSLNLLSDYCNVEWVPFSPINDEILPNNIDGLYIGGGFPEVFAKELSENESMKISLLKHLNSGLPYIAECGGLMYLCDSLKDLNGDEFNMVGWFNGHSYMTKTLQRFGYAELTLTTDCIFGNIKDNIRVHEFHRSVVKSNNKMVYRLSKVREKQIINTWECGYEKMGGIASYAHFHFGSNIDFGINFVNKCVEYHNILLNGVKI